MGFWIFMLITDLLIPVIMAGFGRYFLKRAPNKINPVFGYRTERSMKNCDTWSFAHKYCGRIWYISGLVMLPVSVAVMLPVIGKSETVVGAVGGVLCFLQLIPLMAAIIPTERALERTFDKNGKRR